MEQKIKDLDNYVKDTKTGAVILKRPNKSITDIKIENLENRLNELENKIKLILTKINQ